MIFEVRLCRGDGSSALPQDRLGFIAGDNERNAADRHSLTEEVDDGGWFSRFWLPGTQFKVTLNECNEIRNLADMIRLAEEVQTRRQSQEVA